MSIDSLSRYPYFSWVILGLGTLVAGCGGDGGDGGGLDTRSTVQGDIHIAAGTRVDSDYADLWQVNDESWPADSRGAVALPVPATAAGYLSAEAGNYDENWSYPSDTFDTFTVSLLAGDRYVLQCFPEGGGSADELEVTLSLSPGEDIIGSACGLGGTAPADGPATLTVSTQAGGPFRYVLTIAPQGALSSFQAGWPEPPLRVNEAVLSGPAAAASALSASGVQARSAMAQMRSIGPELWHVIREPTVRALSQGPSAGNGDPRTDTIDWIRTLRQEFGLAVEPNYLFSLAAPTLDDPYYANPGARGVPNNWNLVQIHADDAWLRAEAPSGQGVGVAIMDTGLYSEDQQTYGDWHEDLDNNIVAEGGILDFVGGFYDVDDEPGRDTNPATPYSAGSTADASFHGTHVAGIVAAEDNAIGTIGVAYEATILPYRVLGVDPETGADGVGSLSDLVDAITAAADRPDVDVINLSLGGLPQVDVLQSATDYAHAMGKLVVAAGGNSGDASAVFPAANRRVLGVGATNSNGMLADYSSFGQSVDLLAPGGDLDEGIINAYGPSDGSPSGLYTYLAGTSMAAPHVAGVYALMKGLDDSLSADQFRAQLIAGYLTDMAYQTQVYDYAVHGAGLLNADKALDVTTRSSFPTVVSAWPRVLELDPGAEVEVLLEVLADGALADPQVSGPVTVPSALVMTNGSGEPVQTGDALNGSLRVASTQAAQGRPLSASIEIPYTSDTGSYTLELPVHIQATDPESERNAGRHYVVLQDANDPESGNTQSAVATFNAQLGRYEFEFGDVAPGYYTLVAGSDLDGNGFICESGEACAEYPRTGAPQVVTVTEGETLTLDMTTSFRRPTIAEMGLPRYGFQGYPIPEVADSD